MFCRYCDCENLWWLIWFLTSWKIKYIHTFIYHFMNNTSLIFYWLLFFTLIFPVSTSHSSTSWSSPFSASHCPPSVSGTPRKSTPSSAAHLASPALPSTSSSPQLSKDLTEFAHPDSIHKSFSAHSANLATVSEGSQSAPFRFWSFDAALRPRIDSMLEMMACTLGLSGNCLVFGYCRFQSDSSRMLKEQWFIFTFQILGHILEHSQFCFEVDRCFLKAFHWSGRPLRSWGNRWFTCWRALLIRGLLCCCFF